MKNLNENDPRTPTGSKLIMGPDGQMYDENFIKTIPGGFNNMPEIQRRKIFLNLYHNEDGSCRLLSKFSC